MAITFRQRSPTGQQSAGITFRPRQEGPQQLGNWNRFWNGVGTSAAGFLSNTAQGIKDIIGPLPSERGGRPDIAAEHNEIPGTTKHLRDLQAQYGNLDRQSLEPQNIIERGANFVAETLPTAGINAAPGALKSTLGQTAKTAAGGFVGSELGAPIGEYLGGETGKAIGSVGGLIAGSYAANLIKPREILQQGEELAKKDWSKWRDNEIKANNANLVRTSKDLKKELKSSRTNARKARDSQIKELQTQHQSLLKQVEKGKTKAGQALQETRKAGAGVTAPTDKLTQTVDELEKRLTLGTTEADQALINETIQQVRSEIANGTMTSDRAQEFYQNLGAQRYGRATDSAQGITRRSATDTASIKQAEIQDALGDFIVSTDKKNGRKWLKANEKYSVAKDLEKTIKSPEYKADLKQKERDIQQNYRTAVKEQETAYAQDLKKQRNDYANANKKLAKETYPEFQKRIEKEAIAQAAQSDPFAALIDLTKKRGIPLSTLAAALHYMGLSYYTIAPILGVAGLGAKHAQNVIGVIQKNPIIKQQIHKAAVQAIQDNPEAFAQTMFKVVSNLSGT